MLQNRRLPGRAFPSLHGKSSCYCSKTALSLDHEEMHSKVNYIVAHGISTSINDHKVIIGSYHFVFEDEGCVIPEDQMEKFAEPSDGVFPSLYGY